VANSTIESILEAIKDALSSLTTTEGGSLRHLDVFGGDFSRFVQEFDTYSPGVILYYPGSSVASRDGNGKAWTRTYTVEIILFDFSKLGASERALGFAGNPGVWELEEQIANLIQGATVTLDNAVGTKTKPIRITATGEKEVDQGLSVWAISLSIETPVLIPA